VPKPKVLKLAEANKCDKGKVDSAADEDRQRQVGAVSRPRAIAQSAPPVVITGKRLATTSQGPAGDSCSNSINTQKQRLAQQSEPGMQGPRPDQRQQGGRGPQQKQQLQATTGREPQQRKQQAAVERRGPQQKQ